MSNHVHLIAVPDRKDSFARGLAETHRKYTSLINIREEWKGYLWQGRFISYPLDEPHCFAAVRYVERNPVRAGLVERAEDYPWSSARTHVHASADPLLSSCPLEFAIPQWAFFLGQEDAEQQIKEFTEHETTGRPLGSDEFIRDLERKSGRVLFPRKRGRRKREMSIVSPN